MFRLLPNGISGDEQFDAPLAVEAIKADFLEGRSMVKHSIPRGGKRSLGNSKSRIADLQ